MATTTTTKKSSLRVGLRVGRLLRSAGAIAMGPCLVQAKGAWTRAGPTWMVPSVGWVSRGPGVASWGTTRGLAQLAADSDAAPKWHAVAWTCAPEPNLVFLMEDESLDAPYAEEVARLAAEADAWEQEQGDA